MHKFDVIVVGAGHAGCEAALSAARMGMKTAIFTITLDNVGVMSCNPSIGGPAKSHLVKEIDALGGEMGRNIDKTFVQIRVLNTKKGPAVRSLRAQADKQSYHMEMKKTIENTENLDLIQGMVTDIVVNNKKVVGIKTQEGISYEGKTVVIASGTFMRGLIHIGDKKFQGGRMGELPSNDLPKSLEKYGLKLGRFKTGTPPRIDFRSMDFEKLEPQPGDETEVLKFSNRTLKDEIEGREQISCYITYTNPAVHEVIARNKSKSPLFNGSIEGTGPRYCPSIEDKVYRYQEKNRHHLFLEKEGYGTNEVYISGFSTSLPAEVQEQMIQNIEGLRGAKIMRYGYAIEYDYVLPEELHYSLETKKIENLFLAGQINGTSGYEEAAGQGLLAGINASRKLQGKKAIVLDRGDSYLGTLVDDLVTKGTNEPYRMFTARSEYRLLLREDNADLRLSKIGYEIGLLSESAYSNVERKKKEVAEIIEKLSLSVGSSNKRIGEVLKNKNSGTLKSGTTLLELLRRPRLDYKDIKYIAEVIEGFELGEYSDDVEYQVEVQVKYEGYIKKSLKMIEKHRALEERLIPHDFDYNKVSGITGEAKEKLNEKRPLNIGQASRISGVSPADISVLLMILKIRGDR